MSIKETEKYRLHYVKSFLFIHAHSRKPRLTFLPSVVTSVRNKSSPSALSLCSHPRLFPMRFWLFSRHSPDCKWISSFDKVKDKVTLAPEPLSASTSANCSILSSIPAGFCPAFWTLASWTQRKMINQVWCIIFWTLWQRPWCSVAVSQSASSLPVMWTPEFPLLQPHSTG